MEYTQEQIDARLNSLPEDVKNAISSVEVNDLIIEIGQRHKLMLDQIEVLLDQTALLMIGLEPSSKYESSLVSKLKIKPEEAHEIAKQINFEVLSQIKQSLQEMQTKAEQAEKEAREAAAEKAAPLIPPIPPKPQTAQPQNVAPQPKPVPAPQVNREEVLHAIENPHVYPAPTFKAAVTPPTPPAPQNPPQTQAPRPSTPVQPTTPAPQAQNQPNRLPELKPEQELAIKPGETVHTIPTVNKTSTPITKPPISNILDQKLSGVVSLPREQKVVTNLPGETQTAPKQPQNTEASAKPEPKPYKVDPYREPI